MDWIKALFWLFVFTIFCLAAASVWAIFYYVLFYALCILCIPIFVAGALAIHMRIKGWDSHTYHIGNFEVYLEKKVKDE